ncbi:ATP-binding cassette domain-containing protein [Sphingomonas aracearum]|uniref:ATP-binding cassette domain-containing protein n=1 Tax=Sphingomonas aracearum TaxID=2283317 RepID=A0A369VQC4_9SPHN|nr:ATP-binding cassette domain-containing protein [Sphingomonas aracearum]RDE04598.1 ATP-binding cassette domain-containing protein [Sphingomonas aracearum]
MPPAITFDAVSKLYGEAAAVRSVSLEIASGSFIALVGSSGSGKSTLLKTINRLVPPSAGRVLLDGVDVAAQPSALLRRSIGYVFQNIGLFPHLTVGRNIGIGLELAGRPDPARVAEMLDLVDLPHGIATRLPAELSGGQQQRVGVARALAPGPRLLLMDEPFGALDPITRDALGRKVRDLHERLGLTTIMVTHDMAEALLLASRVLVMAKGGIVADATPADLLAGKAGPEAEALVAVPREQMRRLMALDREA